MVLFLIGLGLGSEKDITVAGLEAVRSCDKVFLEAYTAILGVDHKKLEAFYGRKIILADRRMVEQQSDEIIVGADVKNHAMLVVGDPLAATTHTDMMLRAREKNVPCRVIHNASIMNCVASSGLSLYRFGQTISIPYLEAEGQAIQTSYYKRIKDNQSIGLHTLCLLDIKVKEQSVENLMKGRLIYEPPRFMSIKEAIDQLLGCEEHEKMNVLDANTKCIGLARVGQEDQQIFSGSLAQIREVDFGKPLHSLVIPGVMHDYEEEMFDVIHVEGKKRILARQAEIAAEAKAREAQVEADRVERAEKRVAAELAYTERQAAKAAAAAAALAQQKNSDSDSESEQGQEEDSDSDDLTNVVSVDVGALF